VCLCVCWWACVCVIVCVCLCVWVATRRPVNRIYKKLVNTRTHVCVCVCVCVCERASEWLPDTQSIASTKSSCMHACNVLASLVCKYMSVHHVAYEWVMSHVNSSCHVWIIAPRCHVARECIRALPVYISICTSQYVLLSPFCPYTYTSVACIYMSMRITGAALPIYIYECCPYMHVNVYNGRYPWHMTDSAGNATPPKYTNSSNSNSSLQIQIKAKSQSESVPWDTKGSEFLGLVDFGDVAYSAGNVMCQCVWWELPVYICQCVFFRIARIYIRALPVYICRMRIMYVNTYYVC